LPQSTIEAKAENAILAFVTKGFDSQITEVTVTRRKNSTIYALLVQYKTYSHFFFECFDLNGRYEWEIEIEDHANRFTHISEVIQFFSVPETANTTQDAAQN
jgi:hypothetical protein